MWNLQDAKNKFSALVEKALKEGPQIVQRRGKKIVVVLSLRDYERVKRKKGKLSDFFRESPLSGIGLDLRRDKDTGREESIELSN